MLQTDYARCSRLDAVSTQLILPAPSTSISTTASASCRTARLTFRARHARQSWHQPVGVVNYPQTHEYTRVTEFKHLTGQEHPKTSLTYEYPSS